LLLKIAFAQLTNSLTKQEYNHILVTVNTIKPS
jgi:hypothetical protein